MKGKQWRKGSTKLLAIVCMAACVSGPAAWCAPKSVAQPVRTPWLGEICFKEACLDEIIVKTVEVGGSQSICVGPGIDLLRGIDIPGHGVIAWSEEELKNKESKAVTINPDQDIVWTGPHDGKTRTVKIPPGEANILIIPFSAADLVEFVPAGVVSAEALLELEKDSGK